MVVLTRFTSWVETIVGINGVGRQPNVRYRPSQGAQNRTSISRCAYQTRRKRCVD